MAGLVLIASVLALLLVAWLGGWQRLQRGIVAVLAGYAALLVPFVLLITGFADTVFSPAARWDARMAVFLLGMAGVGLLGGFVSARVARRQELLHAAGLAVFLTAFAAISMVSAPASEPRWPRVAAQAALVPAVLLGGYAARFLRCRRSGFFSDRADARERPRRSAP